jgi:hypothetical protein
VTWQTAVTICVLSVCLTVLLIPSMYDNKTLDAYLADTKKDWFISATQQNIDANTKMLNNILRGKRCKSL